MTIPPDMVYEGGRSFFTVRVFGANLSGFHGAGSAGKLWKPTMKSWRTDESFQAGLKAWKRQANEGILDAREAMQGEYNTLGQTGFQRGQKGYSYGIITTEYPGIQGCVTDDVMFFELVKLVRTAQEHYNKRFYCLDFGLARPNGFSWWTKEQQRDFWQALPLIPKNLIPPSYISCP